MPQTRKIDIFSSETTVERISDAWVRLSTEQVTNAGALFRRKQEQAFALWLSAQSL
jgi:hypothetical protein